MSTERPTIVFVIDDLGIGGAQRQLSLLAPRLADRYRPVVVSLCERTEPFGDALRRQGVEVFALRRLGHVDVRRTWQLARLLDRMRADLVHGFLDAANAYAFLAGRLRRVPVVLSLRNERLLMPGLRGHIVRSMMRRADAVIVNSRQGKKMLEDAVGVPPERLLYVRNCIDAVPATTTDRHSRPAVTVGNIGRLSPQKRLHLLVDAFSIVRDSLRDARLILMGDGEDAAMLRSRVAEHGLGGAVEFIAPGPDVAAVFDRLDCFVLPSAYEGLPNAALEAIARGIPVVATAAGDIGDVVVEGETGVLVPQDRPDAIAAGILKALGEATLRDRVRVRGPEIARRDFSVDSAVASLTSVYNRLVPPGLD